MEQNILPIMQTFDSDDGEFISTFFSVVQSLAAEEEANNVVRTRATINRDRKEAHERLVRDYFADNCVYDEETFATRFRISREVFLRISNALESRYEYFQQRPDARGKMGFSTIQKCTAALRYLGYGITFDAAEEYLKMSRRTARETSTFFVNPLYSTIFGRGKHLICLSR